MSFLNSRGVIFHGVGGGNASIDNVPFSKGAAAGFVSDFLCFYADGDNPKWAAYLHDLKTGESFRAVVDPQAEQFDQGFNTGYAGGGVWAAFQASANDHRGVFSSTGFRLREGGLLAVGPDGQIGYKPDYQALGPSLVITLAGQERVAAALKAGQRYQDVEAQLLAEGLIWKLTDGTAAELQLLGGRWAIWQESQQLRATFGQPLQLGAAWKPMAYQVDGAWWVSYFCDRAGVVLHPADSFLGYRVAAPPAWTNGRTLFNGTVRIAISSGEAEQAGQLRAWDADFSQPREDLDAERPVELTRITRPLWLGFYEFNIGSPALVESPGNCFLAVRGISGEASALRPAIVTVETEGAISGQLLGRFCAGDSVEEVEAQAEAAAARGLRPVAYWDKRRWPRWPSLPPGSWLCQQAYQGASETLAAFEQDLAALLAAAPAGQAIALVPQVYTSNKDLTKDLRPIVGAMTRLAEAKKNVVALLGFSGSGRQTGLYQHPEVQPLWNRVALDLPEPKLEEYPGMSVKPTIIVKTYAAKLEPNKAATILTARIGDTDVVVRLDGGSNLFIEASNPAGEDKTGRNDRHIVLCECGGSTPVPPEPEPGPGPQPPQPPSDEGIAFKTHDGQHWLRDSGGVLDGRAISEEKATRFRIVRLGADNVALVKYSKEVLAEEVYLIAEAGGGGRLLLQPRPQAGPDEIFHLGEAGNKVGFRSRSGHWACAEQGGGDLVVINRDSMGVWESFEPSTPLQQKRQGRVGAQGKTIVDGTGSFFPLGLSFFWALWGWQNGEEPRVRRWLGWMRDHRFDFQRNFCEVGGATWEDRTINASDIRFVDTLKRHLDVSFGDFGVRTRLSVFGSVLGNPRTSMENVKAAMRGRLEAVQSFEGANEANFPDHNLLRVMVREVSQEFPGLLVSTRASFDAFTDESCDLDIANEASIHTERQQGDEDWRQVRQGCEVMFLSKLSEANEPPGLESSVATLEDPLRLAALRLVGIVSGMPAFVLHTGAGIRGGGAADQARGRKPDIWSYGDQIEQVSSALHACADKVPAEAASWRKMKGHWPDTRLVSDAVWTDDPANINHGCVRVYGSYSDSAFVAVVFGIRRFVNLTAKFGPWNLKGYDVLTGAQVFERHVGDGETFRVEGDASGGSNKAVLVVASR